MQLIKAKTIPKNVRFMDIVKHLHFAEATAILAPKSSVIYQQYLFLSFCHLFFNDCFKKERCRVFSTNSIGNRIFTASSIIVSI